MPNSLYPQRELISEWKATGESHAASIECEHCGREFFEADGDDLDAIRANGCSSDDCPSHWEAQNLPHPSYTDAAHRINDPVFEQAFVDFWKGKAVENPALDTSDLFDTYADSWNVQARGILISA